MYTSRKSYLDRPRFNVLLVTNILFRKRVVVAIQYRAPPDARILFTNIVEMHDETDRKRFKERRNKY